MTPGAVIYALDERPQDCGFVVQMPGRTLIEPREIWIEGLHLWVRADGLSICGDMGRGHVYPDWFDRWRIRRAVKRWEKATRSAGGIR